MGTDYGATSEFWIRIKIDLSRRWMAAHFLHVYKWMVKGSFRPGCNCSIYRSAMCQSYQTKRNQMRTLRIRREIHDRFEFESSFLFCDCFFFAWSIFISRELSFLNTDIKYRASWENIFGPNCKRIKEMKMLIMDRSIRQKSNRTNKFHWIRRIS